MDRPIASLQPDCARLILRYMDAPETVVGFLRTLAPHSLDATLAALVELVGFLPLRDVWPALHLRTFMLPRTLDRVVGALPLYDTVHVYDRRHVHAFDARRLVLHPSLEPSTAWPPLEAAATSIVGLECNANTSTPMTFELVLGALATCPRLVSLHLQITTAQSDGVRALLAGLPTTPLLSDVRLHKLEASEVQLLPDTSVQHVASWLGSRHVTRLELRSIDAESPAAAATLSEALLASATIKTLALVNTATFAQALLAANGPLPTTLRHLELGSNQLPVSPTPRFQLLHDTVLTSLDLNGTYLDHDGLQALAALLFSLRHLEALDLSAVLPHSGRMDTAYLAHDNRQSQLLAEILRHLPQLTTLRLARNGVQDADMALLVPALPRCLGVLDVSANQIKNAGLALLRADAMPRLRVLHLKSNAFSNEGARRFSQRLSQWSSLTELSFLGRDMDMYGITMLLTALSTCSQPLMRLDVGGSCCRRANDTTKISEAARRLGLIDRKPVFCKRLRTERLAFSY
ncbi:hypothetical protein SDRG_12057 [Saprolegnia diclina VS20]|uniref:F-box domain-containing protein n=1 Tax=Saprolegnia diclina (strain VS20) TaxID=1156394 RepID=T0Q9P6_SAPDV|nr:hypothetical protein SDRG_12057 [Saprolegnia diclina VS20]EQC30205.1 hypothetical protein SDRG_12057 [Saprolegnia diclina VS20]|eukprot:XP_008616337.1 hypothetical protein SDRG_12057 [Saprolegnia diclina VS20]